MLHSELGARQFDAHRWRTSFHRSFAEASLRLRIRPASSKCREATAEFLHSRAGYDLGSSGSVMAAAIALEEASNAPCRL